MSSQGNIEPEGESPTETDRRKNPAKRLLMAPKHAARNLLGVPRGRPVLSHGPVIRTLLLTSSLSGLVAVGALIFSLVVFKGQLNAADIKIQITKSQIATIQNARQNSAFDTCSILRILILDSSRQAGKVKAGRKFMKAVGIYNCKRYALRIRRGTEPKHKSPPPIIVTPHRRNR